MSQKPVDVEDDIIGHPGKLTLMKFCGELMESLHHPSMSNCCNALVWDGAVCCFSTAASFKSHSYM